MRNNGSKRRGHAPCATMLRCLLGATILALVVTFGGGVASSSTSARRPVYVATVTVKKNTLPAWFAAAQRAATKGCRTGRYRAARVTVRRGVVTGRYDFVCVGGRAIAR